MYLKKSKQEEALGDQQQPASQPAVGGSDCEPRLTRRKRLAGSGFSRSRDGCLKSHDSTVKKCESFFFLFDSEKFSIKITQEEILARSPRPCTGVRVSRPLVVVFVRPNQEEELLTRLVNKVPSAE